MKKLITLFLVLTGIVLDANAWDNLYLLCGANNWTQSDSYKFTRIDADTFYYILDATDLQTNNFIFRIKDTSNDWGAWSNEYELSSTEYAAKIDETGMGFKILSNPDAKFAYIFAKYKKYNSDWRWHLTANIIEETTTVAFVDVDDNWTAPVNAYAWLSNGVVLLGGWPGTEMTYSSNIYTCEVPYASGGTIKFTDKNEANHSEELTLVEDGVYKYDSRVETVNVSAGSLGQATFSCKYPLNFDGITTVKAYRITSASNGVLGTAQITGTVPAMTGLYIEGDADANYDVPTAVTTSPVTTWMVAGTGATVPQTSDNDTKTNFVLTTNKGMSATPKFYKVNSSGNLVAVGKAYLQIPNEYVGAREFFWFDDEETTTGLDKVADNKQAAEYYNLSGQRVAQPVKGLYIVNGKKVIIK